MRHIFFFATPADIRPVLERFEAPERLKFVETGKRTTAERPIYLTSSTIPDPGIATAAASGFCTTYMVSHRETKNIMYAFQDETGNRRWLLSNGDNKDTVLLTLAGIWKTGTLLPGHMNTLHDASAAQQLMRRFLTALRQESFTKIETWWLGPEALAMLKMGKRLATTAEQSPPEFDLKWPPATPE